MKTNSSILSMLGCAVVTLMAIAINGCDGGSSSSIPASSSSSTSASGSFLVAGHAGGAGTAALFNVPNGIVADSNGVLYISDTLQSIRPVTCT
ncbi:MAG TPA: hypothetical protein VG962_06125 [Steroidobacteraceae bacterium]|nr:hypothetical protein [Steroidobacteraceae bacterium]